MSIEDRRALDEVQSLLELVRSARASKASIVIYVEEGQATTIAIKDLQRQIGACKQIKTRV